MAYTLRVLFSGLCAFVPNKPFDSLEKPTEVVVLLQNLIRPEPLSISTTAEDEVVVLDPHFPMLEFDLSDLHPQSPRKPDLLANGKGACLLYGEELSFDLNLPVDAEELRVPAVWPQAGQTLATSDDNESLYWLTRLDKASPGGFVNPNHIDLDQKLSFKDGAPILARMKLTQGYLRVSKLSEHVCTFDPQEENDTPYAQQIATELALDIKGVDGPAVIVIRGLDGTERSLTLNPVKRASVVEVRIQNREIDDFMGVPDDLRPVRQVSDYEVFYQLVDQPHQGIRRRFPKQPKVGPDGQHLKNPSLCPPTGLLVSAT